MEKLGIIFIVHELIFTRSLVGHKTKVTCLYSLVNCGLDSSVDPGWGMDLYCKRVSPARHLYIVEQHGPYRMIMSRGIAHFINATASAAKSKLMARGRRQYIMNRTPEEANG